MTDPRTLRVLHVFSSSLVSGPETLVIPALGKWQQEGRDVGLVFLTETRKATESAKVIDYARRFVSRIESVDVRSQYDRDAIEALAQLLLNYQSEKSDRLVVHAHDVKASAYLLWAAQKISSRRFKIVSTHHGVHARSGLKVKLYEKFYVRYVLPHFDATLTVCSVDRERLLSRGLDPKKVFVHLNGVDRRFVSEQDRPTFSANIRSQWSCSAPRVLGVVARLAHEKRHDRALRLLKSLDLLDSKLEWVALFFGVGPLESALRAQIRELRLEHRVRMMGYRSGMGDEMSGFDVLLSTSDGEGLPINLIEAGWAGTPVVATAIDGNLDLIENGTSGILFATDADIGEISIKIHALISNSAALRSSGLAFHKRGREHFSEQSWLDRLDVIYASH